MNHTLQNVERNFRKVFPEGLTVLTSTLTAVAASAEVSWTANKRVMEWRGSVICSNLVTISAGQEDKEDVSLLTRTYVKNQHQDHHLRLEEKKKIVP